MGKSNKKSKRSRSGSTSSSDSEEKKKRKQIRKQERKKLKEELLKQKELQISQQLFSNYSNIDNPFNDQNLNQKFVWEKKRESELKRGLTTKDLEILDRKKKEQTRLQLEELKKKREQREIELKLLEESKLQLQRDLDRQEMGDWEEKEEEFHLAQAKKRAEIRLEQGRALPIDILALNLSIANDDGLEKKDEFEETNKLKLEMDIQEPYLITQNLSMAQLETLYQDIQYYISLEKNEKNKNFWASMIIVVDSELEKLKLKQDTRLRQGVSESVREQIEKMLSTKTLEQLDQLQKEVEGKLKGGGPADVEYWECLLKELVVWKSKQKLKDMYRFMLKQKGIDPDKDLQHSSRKTVSSLLKNTNFEVEEDLEISTNKFNKSTNHKKKINKDDQVFKGIMYPLHVEPHSILDTKVRENEGMEFMEQERKVKQSTGGDEDHEEEDFEDDFKTDLVEIKKTYEWEDKYKPIKAKFFNRVHTGYEWNKYNRTHYDTDNPPPRVVKGYRFNIYYPDLVDKYTAPSFRVVQDEGYPETVVLKFISGAPYEDIAFRIVNKEWEYSHKKGFKSSFEGGVMKLFFKFKRQYYRR